MLDTKPQEAVNPELYAAIDMGSNSFHMVVIKVVAGSVQVVGKVKQKIRLAAGLDQDMQLSLEAMQRGWDCLEAFAEWLQDIPRDNIRVVATATLRLAVNADQFVKRAERILNHPIAVISGEEEARQIYLGVAYTSQNVGHTLVIDIGGASTEVIVGEGFTPKQLTSLNVGCVTYLERYFGDGQLNESNFGEAIAAARNEIAPIIEMFMPYHWQQCMGASGTPQAIVEILVNQGINDSIRLSYLYDLKQQCIACGQTDKLDIQGLEESRKQPFPSGLAILIALFESLQIKEMQISGGALREGLIYGMLESRRQDNVREQTLLSVWQRFNLDIAHAQRVMKIAQGLLAQLPDSQWPTGFDAEGLLNAAAALHEIGIHIEFKQSHQHAAYLLNYLDLPGYTQFQRDVIRDLVSNYRQNIDVSTIARYQPALQPAIALLSRLLRLSVLICLRRSDQHISVPAITVGKDQELNLTFGEGWLTAHPLVRIELINESWLQHKAGWSLTSQ